MFKFKQKNILIDILSYGKDKLLSGHDFSKTDLKEHLKQKHDQTFTDVVIDTFLKENFEPFKNEIYRINSEGYARLLNQRNLRVATLGVWVAVSLGLISIIIAVWSKSDVTEVKITDKQLSQVTTLLRSVESDLKISDSLDAEKFRLLSNKIDSLKKKR